MTRHLIMDTETIPDPDFPPPEEGKFPSAPETKIITLGVLEMVDYRPVDLYVCGATEEASLRHWVSLLEERPRSVVTGWNIRTYDCPIIAARAFKYGIPMPWWFGDKSARYRFSVEGSYDVMDYLSDFGATRFAKMDSFAKLCGFPGKVGVDGSQVAGMHAAGRQAEIDDYCMMDCVQTAAIFLRTEFLRGMLAPISYESAAEALLSYIAGHPTLAPIHEKIDAPSFLSGSPGR